MSSKEEIQLLLNKKEIEKRFDQWLNTADLTDPKNIETLQRIRKFEVKLRKWRKDGKKREIERIEGYNNFKDGTYE